MRGYSLFQMWEPFRKSLIASHQFYVEQATKRLLSQFTNIEAEADQAAKQWLVDNADRFNPDCHMPGDFEEFAFDAGLEFFELLKDMQGRTRLSVIAGMYHEWDKQLHQWTVDQMRGWCIGKKWESAVWRATLTNLADLFKPLGWAIRSKPYFSQLEACRLVVNVYKHGNGNSLTQLKRKYPQYLHDSVGEMFGESSVDRLSHQHLMVTDDQFAAFSEAIVSFWQDVPLNIYEQKGAVVPGWLSKALDDGSHASGKIKGESTQ